MNAQGSMLLNQAAQKAPRSTVEAAARVLRAGPEPMQAAFVARALNALAQLVEDLDDRALSDAAGATSDYAALLKALEQPEVLAVLRQTDPLASARLRGIEARARLLDAEGGTLAAEQVARHLSISRQAVDKRRRSRRLLALSTGRRGYLYPVWQFGPDGVLAGFEEILRDLRAHDPWAQAAFFLNGSLFLDGTSPLAELRLENVEGVRRAALGYGEQGAA